MLDGRRFMRRDGEGGIEGLPLQLMIMVVIAGIGTAVILGWMTNLEAPSTIGAVYSSPTEIVLEDADGDGIHESDDIDIVIRVLDQKGDGVQGASVVLNGAGLVDSLDGTHVHGLTDESGKVEFSGLYASQAGEMIGFVSVSVTKSGYGTDTSLTIPVISE